MEGGIQRSLQVSDVIKNAVDQWKTNGVLLLHCTIHALFYLSTQSSSFNIGIWMGGNGSSTINSYFECALWIGQLVARSRGGTILITFNLWQEITWILGLKTSKILQCGSPRLKVSLKWHSTFLTCTLSFAYGLTKRGGEFTFLLLNLSILICLLKCQISKRIEKYRTIDEFVSNLEDSKLFMIMINELEKLCIGT